MIDSFFAPAQVATPEEIQQQRQSVMQQELLDLFMQAIPAYAMLLNPQRQIVAVNHVLMDLLKLENIDPILGKRPGEIFGCNQLKTAPGGCGTSPACSVCGAVLSILESLLTDQQAVKDCRLSVGGDDFSALDMQAVASPVMIKGQRFVILSLRDVSAEKRRQVMERIFFHDVTNTAGGIHGIASLLYENESLAQDKVRQYQEWLMTMSGNLMDEIQGQKKLMAAEQGTFEPEQAPFSIRSVLNEIFHLYHHHERVPGRELVLTEGGDYTIVSDASVLRRIIGNMVMNALEATPPGGTVTLSCRFDGEHVMIDVHNPGVIPLDVQRQLFQRSFSTSSSTGRGIGTYCMKLFGERYLKGMITFKSNKSEGTLFTFSLPT